MSLKDRDPRAIKESFYRDSEGYLLSPFNSNKSLVRKYYFNANTHLPKDKILVLSSEGLSGNLHTSGFDSKRNADLLKDSFPDAKIFIVIREQVSFLLSNYFQYLKGGGTHGFKKYFNIKYIKRPQFSPTPNNYVPLIKYYQELYGAEQVCVLPYEMLHEEPKDFISKLSEFIEKDITVDDDQFDISHNSTSDHFTLYYLRFLNIFRFSNELNNHSWLCFRGTQQSAGVIFKLIKMIIPNSLNMKIRDQIRAYLENWVQHRYEKSNIELSRLINIDLSSYGYHDK